jgi:hypothetical protein
LRNEHVRNNNFVCHTCRDSKFQSDAKENGLTWLKQTGKAQGLFRFNACGHEKEIQNNHVRQGNFRCRACVLVKQEDTAQEADLTLLKKLRPHYNLYRFNKCGHEQEIKTQAVTEKRFICRTCRDNKLQSDAKENGLTWLKQTRYLYGLFRFNTCGHEQEIQNSHARRGAFVCQTCDESWATRESNLYVTMIELQGERVIKVGIARDVGRRATEYGTPADAQIVTLLAVPFETGMLAKKAESKVMRAFKHAKHLDAKHLLTKSGKTECFRPEFLTAILEYCRGLAPVIH